MFNSSSIFHEHTAYSEVYGRRRWALTLTRKFTVPLRVYACCGVHVGKFFAVKMSSKKNKNKAKKSSEADGSLLLKDASNDASDLQTSGQEGGSCRSLSSNTFTVTDFIEKGKNWMYRCIKRLTDQLYQKGLLSARTPGRVGWRTWSLTHSAAAGCCGMLQVVTAPPVSPVMLRL